MNVAWLLGIGLLIGQAGLQWIRPEELGQGLEPMVGLLVSLVLVVGDRNLRLAGRDLRRSVGQLLLVRAVLDPAGAAALATGPTVVNSLVHQRLLPPFQSLMLEAEDLLLQPFSAVLALLLLQSTLGDGASWPDPAQRLVAHFGGGVAVAR